MEPSAISAVVRDTLPAIARTLSQVDSLARLLEDLLALKVDLKGDLRVDLKVAMVVVVVAGLETAKCSATLVAAMDICLVTARKVPSATTAASSDTSLRTARRRCPRNVFATDANSLGIYRPTAHNRWKVLGCAHVIGGEEVMYAGTQLH